MGTLTGLERAGFLAHARLSGYVRKVAQATACIQEALTLCQRPVISFSAGKDSTAMLWLCLQVAPQMQVRMLTGGETRLLHPSLDQVLAGWRARFPEIDLVEINVDHVFADGWQDAGFVEQHATFKNGWDRYLHAAGEWDGMFIGLRAGESGMRRWRLSQRIAHTDHAIDQYRSGTRSGKYRICPIHNWSVADVGAIIIENELPLLDTYVTGGMDRRTHYRIGWCSLQQGQLDELRAEHPVEYQKLIERFPELEY